MLDQTEVVTALKDVGFSARKIAEFVQLTPIQQTRILNKERVLILTQLHGIQEQLECLDYLRYRLM